MLLEGEMGVSQQSVLQPGGSPGSGGIRATITGQGGKGLSHSALGWGSLISQSWGQSGQHNMEKV